MDVLLFVKQEFLRSLLGVADLWYRPVHLLLIPLAPSIDLFLLRRGQLGVLTLRNLKLEADGDMRTGRGCLDRIGSGIVIVGRHMGGFGLLPLLDNDLTETFVPGIGTIRLQRGEFPLLCLIETQVGLRGLGTRAGVVVKPRTNFLTRESAKGTQAHKVTLLTGSMYA